MHPPLRSHAQPPFSSQAAARYGVEKVPKLVDIIAAVPEEQRTALMPRLRAKPVRSASGIAVVAVMSKPHRCPHIATTGAICVYCPGGPDSDFEYSTQSYTGYEPTSMRAIRARYDPYLQARSRVDQLRRLGHAADKVEYILMGGTFMSLPPDYREAVSLKFARNMRYSEIAEALGITVIGVKMRISRAKAMIAAKVSDAIGGDER